jgi:hypothetical protein
MINQWEMLLEIQSLEIVLAAPCELTDAFLKITLVSSRLEQLCSAVAPTHIDNFHTSSHSKLIVSSVRYLIKLSNSKLITRRQWQCSLFGLN